MNALLPKIILCSTVCLGLGFLSGFVGDSPLSDWFVNLNKPSFQPPSWLFGPVWSILYCMIGASLALIWHQKHNGSKSKYYILFAIQMILNLAWSPVFFGMKNLSLALGVIILLWVFIVLCIHYFKEVNTKASLLLWPYLFWVSFATFLNYTIMSIN